MRIDVRYFSKGGATKKLADAIAEAVGAEAKTVDVPLEVNFISANAKNIGKIVVFGSACTKKSTYAAIKSAAAGSAVKTAEMFFQCKGEFLFLNKGRPNTQDCADAAEFARKQVKLLGVT